MKVGSLVYATDQGLGILAKSFYDHGIVTHPMVVRHGRHETHDDWYPKCPQITNVRDPKQLETAHEFCSSVDVMLFFETPFWWELISYCKKRGIKTVVSVMHECMPLLCAHPDNQPDMWLCPSRLDFNWADKLSGGQGSAVELPVPVEVPWRLRTRAETFVHNAGHGGLKGRNGTAELVAAIKLLKSDARIVIRSQGRGFDVPLRDSQQKVDVRHGTEPYEGLFSFGDVFVFPERHNGLSLPLQEAFASGMLVMAGNRFPMNTWLPNEPLIPVERYVRDRIGPAYYEFESARYTPESIARQIDLWYSKDITTLSERGRQWAAKNSWDVLKPMYMDLLHDLCK